MTRTTFTLTTLALCSTLLSGCVIHVGDDSFDGQNISKVFGSISIDEHRHVEDIDTVNGSIELGDHVQADNVDSVNGGVDAGDHVTVGSIDVVNGDIEVGKHFSASGDVETINGDITLATDGNVGGNIETINGDITLDTVVVGGNIETVNGDITVTGASQISGDIVFAENNNDNWNKQNIPTLTLDENVSISGNIIVKRRVDLQLATDAQKAKVIRRFGSE